MFDEDIQNLIIFKPQRTTDMNVKTDTKERFSVIFPQEKVISANMAENLGTTILNRLQMDIPHVVINMESVQEIAPEIAEKLSEVYGSFLENKASMVICCLQPAPLKLLSEMELLDTFNITPTESEAWDIVQMEEIERELSGDNENNIQ